MIIIITVIIIITCLFAVNCLSYRLRTAPTISTKITLKKYKGTKTGIKNINV